MLDLAEKRIAGAFNGTAPPGRTTMREALEAAVHATGSRARLHWVPDEVLVAHDVEPWDELPLWIPAETGAGTWAVGTERAHAAGATGHRHRADVGTHSDRHGDGGDDHGPPLRRALHPRPRRLGPAGSRGLVRPVVRQAAGAHARVHRDRARRHRPPGAGH